MAMGMFAAMPASAALLPKALNTPLQPAEPEKPGFFDRGGTGRAIIGNLADGILQSMGQQPTYQMNMQHQRALQEAQARRQQALEDQFGLWQRKEQWEREHPAPTQPNDFSRRIDVLNSIEPGLGSTYARNYAANGGGMPQITTIPGIGTFAIPRTPAAPQSAPRISSREEYDRLPSGSSYVAPDGSMRVKGGDPASGGGAGLTTPRPFP